MPDPATPRGRGLSANATGGARTGARPEAQAAKLAMVVLLVSLSMFFAATLVAYVIVRTRAAGGWPPAGAPHLPPGLWASTAVAILLSVAIESGLRGIRRGDRARLVRGLNGAFALAVAFLLIQALNWAALLRARGNLYGFTFYMLTGLHAGHVIGGMIPLGIVARRAGRGAYSPASHNGIVQCAIYWEYLVVVWIVIFIALHV